MEKKFLNYDEISEELEKVSNSQNSRNYWKMLVLGTIENLMDIGKDYKVTSEDIDNMVDNLLKNDNITNVIDEEIFKELAKFKTDILDKMRKDLDKTRTDLMNCVNPTQLDSLAYKVVVKNEIFSAIENEIIDISKYIDKLQDEEYPLERLYNIFEDMIIDNKTVSEETIVDCLNIFNKEEE